MAKLINSGAVLTFQSNRLVATHRDLYALGQIVAVSCRLTKTPRGTSRPNRNAGRRTHTLETSYICDLPRIFSPPSHPTAAHLVAIPNCVVFSGRINNYPAQPLGHIKTPDPSCQPALCILFFSFLCLPCIHFHIPSLPGLCRAGPQHRSLPAKPRVSSSTGGNPLHSF